MRRNKAEMKETMDYIHQEIMMPTLRKSLSEESQPFVCDVLTSMLSHPTLSMKQFEELYWPYMKDYLDACEAANKSVAVFCENTIMRFAEFFQDYKKGTLMLFIEQDNPIELRKKLPNACICGGMSSLLLGRGTPKECVDFAERLIKEMGDGFILSQDKMISFRNDCKRENLLAVCDYVRNFRW